MLSVQNLTLARGDRVLVRGLSFDLKPGEAKVVTGANGAGKTSLLRAVAGLLRPEAGTVALNGLEEHAHSLHLIGHQDGLKAGRTAEEEVRFWCGWAGAKSAGFDQAIDQLALRPLLGLPVRALSAGQRKRLALARLLAAPRPLWLLDETLAPLDAGWRQTVAAMAQAHLADGGMILAAAHDPMPFEHQVLDLGAGR
ncbi:MAG: heme ABC exporter ATP-binding protein CcmA [Caulobacterales bacterium]|nr:heme ABC exporter ATP-binding protein CcmA [Caulobacterales bacterium]